MCLLYRSELDSCMGFRISRLCVPALDDDYGIPSIQRPLSLMTKCLKLSWSHRVAANEKRER